MLMRFFAEKYKLASYPGRVAMARASFVALFASSILVGGCAKQEQHQPPAPQMPAGIILNAAPPVGIYPAYGELCCWVGPDVRFAVAVRSNQRELVLSVFQPKAGPLKTRDQMIRFVSPDGTVAAQRTVRGGTSAVVIFPVVPSAVTNGILAVHLQMSGSFIPKEQGTSADVRRLAMILAGVSVR